MTSSFYLAAQWLDNSLKWDPTDENYGNLTEGSKFKSKKLKLKI